MKGSTRKNRIDRYRTLDGGRYSREKLLGPLTAAGDEGCREAARHRGVYDVVKKAHEGAVRGEAAIRL